MAKNKGGRPAHHEGEIKKAAIAVRTAPSIRDALQLAARASGRSVTQEVEARLSASLERDAGKRTPETEQLLNRFAAQIAEIEKMTGRHWHKDRRTAGAVLELFEKKPRHWIRTDDPYDDEFVEKAWRRLNAARERREKIAEYMAKELGMTIEQAKPKPKGGLFGLGDVPNLSAGLLGNLNIQKATSDELTDAVTDALKGRWRERMQIQRMELPENITNAALLLIDQLEQIDEEELAADEEYGEAISPFIDAELEGRNLYREWRRRRAAEAANTGKPYDVSDWFG